MDPFNRGLAQSKSDGGRPPHYTKTRAPAISSQSQARNGHLSVSVAPVWSEAAAQPSRKMGVASLLFHRTLSPKDTLQVHSYTLEKQRQPHTQLQVHSYAREHQPRHLQPKTCTVSNTGAQSPIQTPSSEKLQPQPESKIVLTKAAPVIMLPKSPVEQDQNEDKPQISTAVEAKTDVERPRIETNSTSTSYESRPQDLGKVEVEAPKNKRKARFLFPFLFCFHHKLLFCFKLLLCTCVVRRKTTLRWLGNGALSLPDISFLICTNWTIADILQQSDKQCSFYTAEQSLPPCR